FIPSPPDISPGDKPMCTVGGPVDIEFNERVKGKNYRCKECGERFKGIGKRPMCPSCQSEDVEEA
ncbi:MAG: hypothetical protein WC138_07590, partial [Methanoculleus sp.]